MSGAPPAVEVLDVRKSFGGVRAVQGCSLQVEAGTITGLIGPNGAGKSTLLSIIAGALRADEGEIRFGGQRSPGLAHQVARMGIARTFQVPQEFPRMTVLENMLVSMPMARGERVREALAGPRTWRAAQDEALDAAWALLHRFQLARLANEYAANLSGGQKKLLEFARALQQRPRVILLDEPMAGVNPSLRATLEEHIATFPGEGITVLMIEHEMGIVSRLCAQVVVMAEGRVIAQGTFQEIEHNADVVAAYLGQSVEEVRNG